MSHEQMGAGVTYFKTGKSTKRVDAICGAEEERA